MADPLSWAGPLTAKYGPTAAGLAIGTAAKYGLTLTEGRRLSWRGVIGDLLLLGILGLIAILIADWWDLTGDSRVLVGALSAVSSDRLVRLARDRFFKVVEDRIGTDLDAAMKASPEAIARVPAGAAPASSAQLIIHRSADPRAAGVERLAEGPLPKNSAELDALISRLSTID